MSGKVLTEFARYSLKLNFGRFAKECAADRVVLVWRSADYRVISIINTLDGFLLCFLRITYARLFKNRFILGYKSAETRMIQEVEVKSKRDKRKKKEDVEVEDTVEVTFRKYLFLVYFNTLYVNKKLNTPSCCWALVWRWNLNVSWYWMMI